MVSDLIKLVDYSSTLLQSTKSNIKLWLTEKSLPEWAQKSIAELIQSQKFDELNNRFYKSLEFGTGGIRSRTIGEVITSSELGESRTKTPEHTAVGSAYVNDFNIIRATIALFRYSKKFLPKKKNFNDVPSVVIAHDNRHFSKHFCELAASTWIKLGGDASIFDGPRSTPQLSFSIRHLRTTAGIMITASHNPSHDNGFKVYFQDGAQMIDPHASGTIAEFDKISLGDLSKFYEKNLRNVNVLNHQADKSYALCVEKTLSHKAYLLKSDIKIVFTPLHGTGGTATIPILRSLNLDTTIVEEQNDFDPNFSTVKSPNPENKEALTLAIQLAKNIDADVVFATDPDGDRLAVAAKNKDKEFEYFSGNITGAMLAEYLISSLIEQNEIPEELKHNATIIKSFVTSPLFEKIAKKHGIRCVNTLTGFKWIGKKLLNYEQSLQKNLNKSECISIDYDKTAKSIRRELLLKYSTFFIFGCEESYGCLANDLIRDKDANIAVLLMCELAAYLKTQKKTLCDFRDDIYNTYGYFGEDVLNIYYEGADGAKKIENILKSYKINRPSFVNKSKVIAFTDFSTGEIIDEDIEPIPAQDFFVITLEDGCKYAIRASGTEPKIKFYLFAEGKIGRPLNTSSKETQDKLSSLKKFLLKDANIRSN